MGEPRTTLLRSVVVATATGAAVLGLALPASAAAPAPDPGFGAGGVVTVASKGAFLDVVPMADGGAAAVSAAGIMWNTNDPVEGIGVVYRFDAHGDLDASFGPSGTTTVAKDGYQLQFAELEKGPRGTLIAIGRYAHDGGACGVAVARLSASTGQLDASFGSGGLALLGSGSHLACPLFTIYQYPEGAGTVLPDGRVLVVDQYYSRTLGGRPDTSSPTRIFVAALTATGAPISSFGSGGHVLLAAEAQHLGRVHVAADGSLLIGVAAVTTSRSGRVGAVGVWRLSPNGVPDLGFGNRGLVLRRPFGQSYSKGLVDVVPQSGRRVVIAGALDPVVDMFWRQSITAVVRVTADGRGDATFARGAGYQALPALFVSRMQREADGSLVLVGAEDNGDWDSYTRKVGRAAHLTAGGVPDVTWGSRGVRTVTVPGQREGLHLGLAVQPSGRLLLAGQWTTALGWGDPPVPAATLLALSSSRPSRTRGWLEARLSGAYGGWRACGTTATTACAVGTTWYLSGGGWPFEARDSSRVVVQVQRRGADGVWRAYPAKDFWVTDDGAFRAAGKVVSKGLYRFRAAVPASASTVTTYSAWSYGRK